MNMLSYGLLSLLAFSPSSGYDLMLRIQPFWPAKHSQIYPLLASLEEQEYVTFKLVCQIEKPDKKVYRLTDKGRLALREWLAGPTAEPTIRDEFLLKACSLSHAAPGDEKKLFEERIVFYENKVKKAADKMRHLRTQEGWAENETPAFGHPMFGFYILVVRAEQTARMNIEWCRWAMSLLPGSGSEGELS